MSAMFSSRGFAPLLVLVVAGACKGQAPAAPAPGPRAEIPPPSPLAAAPVARASGPIDPAIAALDQRIGPQLALVRQQGMRPSPTDLEILAHMYLERAGLSGDYDDYGKAEQALDLAVQKSAPGAGPLLARAHFRYTVHQLARAGQDLDVADRWVIKKRSEIDTIAGLRTDIAFHAGQYRVARAGYEKDLDRNRAPGQAVSLAQLEWKTGHFARAEALFAKARAWAQDGGKELRAWVAMSEGLMELDRGRSEVALADFERGLQERPGFWSLQEHRAEVLASLGRDDEALASYLDLIARTHDPEFMDAAARIYEKRGDQASARPLVAEARKIYEHRLARFPEATAGHALEFFLRRDPRAAVPIAELNAAARPGGEAQVLLARTYLLNARPEEARKIVEAALATEWNTAVLHAVAAQVFAALDDRRAAGERKKALALNPHVFGPAAGKSASGQRRNVDKKSAPPPRHGSAPGRKTRIRRPN